MKAAVCQCLHGAMPELRPNYSELLRRIDLEGEPPGQVAKDSTSASIISPFVFTEPVRRSERGSSSLVGCVVSMAA